MENPNFYAIIPAHVRYSDIIPNAKLLYGEITALSNKTGYCYASNSYFAGLYGVDVRQIKRWISSLIMAGFISVEIDMKSGNLRHISLDEKVPTLGTKKSLPSGRKSPYPRDEKVPYNNTMNNTMNNTVIIIDEEEQKKHSKDIDFNTNRRMDSDILILKKDEDNIIDHIDDLRRFLNKGKLQEKFFYKIGDDESFERVTADFFIYCEDKGLHLKKNTAEARFLAYLKPKWESDQDRRNMIEAVERKKVKYIDPSKEMEKQREEYKKEIIIAKEFEGTLTEEERKEILNRAEERAYRVMPGVNKDTINKFAKSFYYKGILEYKKQSQTTV